MENSRILVDTSIIIDFWRKKNKQKSSLWKLQEEYFISISSITEFELLIGANTQEKIQDIYTIIKHFNVLDFDSEIACFAAEIYKDLKKKNLLIDFNDIFIGATALKNKLRIATFNIEHFKRIKKLELIEVINQNK
ncbi:MAG: type II toxin-antitoxin system VapC family toxin [Bacteroidales bacterium]|nr:type II toxin-antitoxin system VapC family toxin [Bacteroidales bacterium]